MNKIPQKSSYVKYPAFLAVTLALLALLFPGWQFQAKPRKRQEFNHVAYLQALDISLKSGYNSVNWGTL